MAGVSLPAVADITSCLVEEAVFLAACRTRGLLPEAPPEHLRHAAVDRLGPALFQCEEETRGRESLFVNNYYASKDLWPTKTPDPFSPGIAKGHLGPGTLAALDGIRADADLLGLVHGRLLGLSPKPGADGRVRTAKTKAAAKADGVFYTPPFVTRYMVARALESLRDSRLAGCEAAPPRILDLACGCGAFLLAAYRSLRDQAIRNTPAAQTDWPRRRLAILERLHGVDLDGPAVLAARRALWLEAADEPAGPLSVDESGLFFRTIRQGNALVDAALDRSPGPFDLVLGNPPYRRERGAKTLLDQIAQTDFGRRWRTARMDLWYYFAHRAVELLRDEGVLSLIVSAYWTAGRGAAKLVEQFRREMHVEEIFDLDRLRVFDGVAGHHMILRARKTRGPLVATVVKRPGGPRTASAEPFLAGRLPLVVFEKTADELFHDGRIDLEPIARELVDAVARAMPLGRLGRVRQGIAENPAAVNQQTVQLARDATVGEGVFVLTADEVDALEWSDEEKTLLRPYHQARDIGRYEVAQRASRTLLYTTAETCPDLRTFPAVERHLARFRPIMEARRETRLGRRGWWQLHWPRDASIWTADKILSVQMAPRPTFASAAGPVYVSFSVNAFVPDRSTREHLFYLTALLNSRVLEEWFRHHAKRRGVGLEINGGVFARAPIRRIDFALASDRRMHDELVELAGEISRVRACTHRLDASKPKPVGQAVPDVGPRVGRSRVRRSLTYAGANGSGACEHAPCDSGACKHAPYDPTESLEHRIDAIVARLYGLG